jgi:hypothetical protein
VLQPCHDKRYLALLLGLATLACGPLTAVAQDYLPLAIGNQWYYENDLGETQLMTIIGDETILGVPTRVRRQDATSDLFENFWTRGPDGSLYLHGARNLLDHVEWAFQPPLEMADAPLCLGKAWVTHDVQLYNLDGTPMGGDPLDYPLRVDFAGDVEVPAGAFYAFGVGFDPDSLKVRGPGGKVFDIYGRRLASAARRTEIDITAWYSDGVGLVLQTIYADEQHPLELMWWNPPTPTVSTSWGRIKTLFEEHR